MPMTTLRPRHCSHRQGLALSIRPIAISSRPLRNTLLRMTTAADRLAFSPASLLERCLQPSPSGSTCRGPHCAPSFRCPRRRLLLPFIHALLARPTTRITWRWLLPPSRRDLLRHHRRRHRPRHRRRRRRHRHLRHRHPHHRLRARHLPCRPACRLLRREPSFTRSPPSSCSRAASATTTRRRRPPSRRSSRERRM